MATTSQRVAPSIVVEGSTPACDKCKRKVVDSTEAEQSFKLKQIHWWKKLWRLRLWGDDTTRGSHEGRERETKNELQVLKRQLMEEHELHQQEKEFQREQVQQEAQHAQTDDTTPI